MSEYQQRHVGGFKVSQRVEYSCSLPELMPVVSFSHTVMTEVNMADGTLYQIAFFITSDEAYFTARTSVVCQEGKPTNEECI